MEFLTEIWMWEWAIEDRSAMHIFVFMRCLFIFFAGDFTTKRINTRRLILMYVVHTVACMKTHESVQAPCSAEFEWAMHGSFYPLSGTQVWDYHQSLLRKWQHSFNHTYFQSIQTWSLSTREEKIWKPEKFKPMKLANIWTVPDLQRNVCLWPSLCVVCVNGTPYLGCCRATATSRGPPGQFASPAKWNRQGTHRAAVHLGRKSIPRKPVYHQDRPRTFVGLSGQPLGVRL